ncbi:hypothetical protein [Corynebacterium sp.]|uniref:hypothetical protein n=1 Tax=Corynebacterium sp. TaxID=1720 RepID=UPI0026DA8523|nr:hypothetical protein [Corynebacterium sp.]MDO5032388.1 hypothetical protein [Corynebacterium sp.]
MPENFGRPNPADNGNEETRQFGRVGGNADSNETRAFGQPEDRPRQVFPSQNQQAPGQQGFGRPGPGSAYGSQQGYGQTGQQSYSPQDFDPVPSSYEVDKGKKSGGGALAGVFAAIAAIAVVAAVAFFFMWRSASSEADKPAPEPVTETATVTEEVPTTVTETEEAPAEDRQPTLPTEVPTELQDQLDQGTQDLEGLLNDLFGDSGAGGQGATNDA